VIHAEQLCFNPLTGRKVWLLRNIPGGDYGDRWDASLVVVREGWRTRKTALMLAGENITLNSVAREIRGTLADLGFSDAWAMRNGLIKTYKVKTRGMRRG
jgi:hypothetical protein